MYLSSRLNSGSTYPDPLLLASLTASASPDRPRRVAASVAAGVTEGVRAPVTAPVVPPGLRRRMPRTGAARAPGAEEHVVAVGESPFDTSGVEVGEDGIRRYTSVSGTVVDMLRSTVERYPERTAVVELGGPSATYGELWERALRVAGGLRDAGVARATGWRSGWATGWTGCWRSGAGTSPARSSSR